MSGNAVRRMLVRYCLTPCHRFPGRARTPTGTTTAASPPGGQVHHGGHQRRQAPRVRVPAQQRRLPVHAVPGHLRQPARRHPGNVDLAHAQPGDLLGPLQRGLHLWARPPHRPAPQPVQLRVRPAPSAARPAPAAASTAGVTTDHPAGFLGGRRHRRREGTGDPVDTGLQFQVTDTGARVLLERRPVERGRGTCETPDEPRRWFIFEIGHLNARPRSRRGPRPLAPYGSRSAGGGARCAPPVRSGAVCISTGASWFRVRNGPLTLGQYLKALSCDDSPLRAACHAGQRI